MELTKKAFEQVLATVPEQQRSADTKKSVLDNLSGIMQVAAEARAVQFDKDPTRAFQLKMKAEQDLATAYLVDQMNKMTSDEFLKDWYSRNQTMFSQWKARHILVRTQGSVIPLKKGAKDLTDAEALAKAKALRTRLAGGADFAAMAKVESDDVGSGSNGGDLGFFGPGDMVPAIEGAVTKLKLKELSEPVKTDFGYHVIELLEIRAKPFEDAKEEIVQKSRADLQAKVIETIRKKHPVTLDQAYFGN